MFEAAIKELQPTTNEITATDDLAVEIGSYRLITGENAIADQGSHIVQWHEVDGTLLNHRDIATTSMAADPSA